MNSFYQQRDMRSEFLEQRPDYYLGRFFQSFSDKVFGDCYNLKCNSNHSDNNAQKLIYNLIVENFTQNRSFHFNCEQRSKNCVNVTQKLISTEYETFMDVVKHSRVGNTTKENDGSINFEDKYSKVLFTKTRPPIYLTDQVGMIPFCDIAPKLQLSTNAEKQPLRCNLFKPFITSNGLCDTFNALSMSEIFKPLPNVVHWSKVFNQAQKSHLFHPIGYGPSNGFNFILNSFEYVGSKRSSNNFIMSITNENNPYDVYKENYIIEPGHLYTFRILANQVITNERFNGLNQASRNCSLPHESVMLNLTQNYSKSACEYECAIRNAINHCNCTPWNVPRTSMESPTFCDISRDNNCFEEKMKNISTLECGCPSDCHGTYISVFESSKIIENPAKFCSIEKIRREYPYSVFCGLCNAIVKTKRFRLMYENIVNGGLDPINLDNFCNAFIQKNIAVVKVEMATKSITRSLKDTRFNFVTQLSSLGKPNNVRMFFFS